MQRYLVSCIYFPGFDRINIKTKVEESAMMNIFITFLMNRNNAIIIFMECIHQIR